MSAYVPIPTEAGLDAGWWPWLAPDPCPFPRFDLFPRLARIARMLGLGREREAVHFEQEIA